MPIHTPRLARPLCSVFAALLAGCTERDVPGESSDDTGIPGTDTTDSTDPGPTTGEPGTDSSSPTTANPATSETVTDTASASDTATTDSASASDTVDTTQPMCVYKDHEILLTPDEYDAWLHGMGEVGSTGDTDSAGTDGTGGTAGPDSTGGSDTTADPGTSTSTSTGDTGDSGTTGALEWSTELCNLICDALTSAEDWNIVSCEKTGTDEQGNVSILCVEIVEQCDGRSHACITSRGALAQPDPVAAYLARAAHDEAASVYAFTALALELAALGAPATLLARIVDAAGDELRHAQAVARLVADRGGRCRPPQRRPVAPRSARELAIENAVEGCVRETWAALLAAHQAEHAADPQVRAVMRGIAADEARHAELAWAIDAWLHTQLGPDAHAEIAAARQSAAAAVVAGVAAGSPAPALVHDAGVPVRARAVRLVSGLADALWAA